jgi:membrane protease YdiL (CAAX protease family)
MFSWHTPHYRFVNPTNRSGGVISLANPWAATALLGALVVVVLLAFVPSVSTRVLVLLAVAPVLEETVFRAGLHEWLLRSKLPAGAPGWVASALTALAFAAVHVFANPDLLAALTFLPALAIGALYQRSRRLLPCIALHAFFNGLWLLGSGALVA